MKVELTRDERLFDGFLKLDRTHFHHQTPHGGMSPEVMRLTVERGDGAGVLLVNRRRRSLILTRQFRLASWKRNDGGAMIEIPAGVVPQGADPETIARSEVFEETGRQPDDLRFMLMIYASPGTTTERVFLYYAEVDDSHTVADGGGLESEHEYIEVLEIPIADALESLDRGDFTDAKTVVALQWARQNVWADWPLGVASR